MLALLRDGPAVPQTWSAPWRNAASTRGNVPDAAGLANRARRKNGENCAAAGAVQGICRRTGVFRRAAQPARKEFCVNAAFDILDRTDRELWVVTAQAAGRRGGLIATFVTGASIVPEMPRVLVGLARQHQTWELVERSGVFALHLLGEEHLEWVWRFGLDSGRDADKVAGLTVTATATGNPVLA